MAGTEGKALSIEALKIKLAGLSEEDQKDSKIIYKTHVQSYGWQKEVENGALAGTTGQGKRVEAVSVRLEGAIAKNMTCTIVRIYRALAGLTGQRTEKRPEAVLMENV